MAHELALSGTLLYTFTHPLHTLYNCEIRVTETEKKMQNIEVTQKLKSFYKVSNWKLRVFKHFPWQFKAKCTFLNDKRKTNPDYCSASANEQ